MSGSIKLTTPASGAVNLTPASSIASDVTVKVPVTGVNNGTLVCSDSSGNVGIGTSSPNARLHVCDATSTNGTVRFGSNSTYYSDIQNIYANDEFRFSSYGSAQKMTFFLNGSERMRIDSSGNLLVGRTASDVNGSGLMLYSQSGTGGRINYMKSASGTQSAAVFFYNGTTVGSINYTDTNTSFNTSSDYRLKENIQPMRSALGVVAQLNPVTYTWKADGSDGQGFIAHELQAVVPDCVTGEKDAVDAEGNPVYQGIDTSFLVATLTKAIQEQQAQIETLTAKVAALEAK